MIQDLPEEGMNLWVEYLLDLSSKLEISNPLIESYLLSLESHLSKDGFRDRVINRDSEIYQVTNEILPQHSDALLHNFANGLAQKVQNTETNDPTFLL